jgi:hypothetical protein
VPSVSWPSIAGIVIREFPMHSDTATPNLPLFFLGLLGLVVGLAGMVTLTLTQSPLVAFPLVVLGFSTFVTAMMMCAKTTGGPQD